MNREAILLTPQELAERLRVTPSTITSWRRRGTIPFIKVNSTVYRFDYAEVVSTLRTRTRHQEARA